MKKKKLLIFIIMAVAAVLAVSIFFIFRGGKNSIAVTPLISVKPDLPGTFYDDYSQKDERWAKDRLGQAADTMAVSGCLTCCIAGSLNAQGLYEQSPGELNRLFSDNQAYNENGAIIWAKLEQALSGVRAITDKKLTNKAINDSLERGEYPIVKVRTKNGVFHWVTLTEADLEEGSFYCLDPLNGKVSLDKYGNRVYGIRIVTKK